MADTTITFPATGVLRFEGSATTTPFLYVCDSGNNRIQVTDYDGNFLFAFGTFGTGNGQFNTPYGVCNDGTRVYVSDTGNNRVQIFDLFGNYISQFGTLGSGIGEFNTPKGIATDGRLLCVVDQANNRFHIFTIYGALIMSIGTFGSGINQFNAPTNIAIDEFYIYIDDTGNSRVVIYEKSFLQAYAAITLPMFTVAGTFYGHWWSGSAILPIMTVTGAFSGRGMFSGEITLPMLSAAGTFTAHQEFTGSAVLPMFTVSGAFSSSGVFSAKISLPMLSASGTFTSHGVFSANITLPMLVASGVFSGVLAEAYHAIAVNTEIFAVTEYTNYPFNSMAEFNGKYYASGASGIVRLDGATDLSSQPILPVVRFGTDDLHSGVVKKLVDSYFTGKTNEKTVIKFIYDEDEVTPVNTFKTEARNTVGSRTVRVKVPQGMDKKRYITVEIQNADEIDNHRLIVDPIYGRVR